MSFATETSKKDIITEASSNAVLIALLKRFLSDMPSRRMRSTGDILGSIACVSQTNIKTLRNIRRGDTQETEEFVEALEKAQEEVQGSEVLMYLHRGAVWQYLIYVVGIMTIPKMRLCTVSILAADRKVCCLAYFQGKQCQNAQTTPKLCCKRSLTNFSCPEYENGRLQLYGGGSYVGCYACCANGNCATLLSREWETWRSATEVVRLFV